MTYTATKAGLAYFVGRRGWCMAKIRNLSQAHSEPPQGTCETSPDHMDNLPAGHGEATLTTRRPTSRDMENLTEGHEKPPRLESETDGEPPLRTRRGEERG